MSAPWRPGSVDRGEVMRLIDAALDPVWAVLRRLGVAAGSGTVTFSGSQNSANTTVAHGLRVEPRAVVMVAQGSLGWNLMRLVSKDDAEFTVQGHDVDSARTGSDTFFWVAVK